ncbi:hypothetical protein P879_06668, partial [Paragonimus westermani]
MLSINNDVLYDEVEEKWNSCDKDIINHMKNLTIALIRLSTLAENKVFLRDVLLSTHMNDCLYFDISRIMGESIKREALYPNFTEYHNLDAHLSSLDIEKNFVKISLNEFRNLVITWICNAAQLQRKIYLMRVFGSLPSILCKYLFKEMHSYIEVHPQKENTDANKWKVEQSARRICLQRFPVNISSRINKLLTSQNEKSHELLKMIKPCSGNSHKTTASKLYSKIKLFQPVLNFARDILVPVPMKGSENEKPFATPNDASDLLPKSPLKEGQGENGLSFRKTADTLESQSTFEAVLQSSYEELVRSSWNGISKEMQVAYSKSPVKYLLMEERNVYCGVHNVFVLYERGSDEKLCKKRVVHTDGGRP